MSTFSNRLSRTVDKLEKLPAPCRRVARSLAFGRAVPFVGTAGLSIDEMNAERLVVSTPNRRRVQNHIQGIHAAAMALLAETATGLLVGMNVPDSAVPLIKSMKVEYRKRTQGGMTATATLTPEQIEKIRTEPKGDVTVAVSVTDESGKEPIQCEMIWAWVPKKRKKS